MKKLLAVLITCGGMLWHAAEAATAEVRHTHAVFFPGVDNQPVLQLKIQGNSGEKITSLKFSTGESSSGAKFKVARLLSTGRRNAFTVHTQNPAVEKASKKNVRGNFSFDTEIELTGQPLYLWLSYDLPAGAKLNAPVDALCTEIKMADGSIVQPQTILADGVEKRVVGRVTPFPYRIMPYYRPRWVKGWGKSEKAVHLTPEHFHLFTDLIHFAYSLSAQGEITYQWAGGGNSKKTVDDALAEIKRLHQQAGAKSRLIAGFGHMDDQLTKVISRPAVRRQLARNMAKWTLSRGYQGIDLDWEYPENAAQWNQFALFLAELREELAGSGVTISIAASVNYRLPTLQVTDQVDFILTMSYGSQSAQHASMERYRNEANICLNKLRMPKPKVVLGLPFYSNEQGKLTDQYGYSQIYNWYPNLKPDVNTFRAKKKDGSDGPMHSFNGRNMITDKCRWAKDNDFGGVMIWAYETDLPLSHHASLGRAMYKVLRQPRKK